MTKQYIAGLFDGEGSIGIYSVGKYWCVKLAITGTYMPMLKAIYDYYGYGSLVTQKRQSLIRTPRYDYGKNVRYCKQGWKWFVSNKEEILKFLSGIYPYLIEKKEQVKIALKFLNGEIDGKVASELCKKEKRFYFNSEHHQDIISHHSNDGEKNSYAKLTNNQAIKIRKMFKQGVKQTDIANRFNISRQIVFRIVNHLSYKGV